MKKRHENKRHQRITARQVRRTLERTRLRQDAASEVLPKKIAKELQDLHSKVCTMVKGMGPDKGFKFLLESGLYTPEEGFAPEIKPLIDSPK